MPEKGGYFHRSKKRLRAVGTEHKKKLLLKDIQWYFVSELLHFTKSQNQKSLQTLKLINAVPSQYSGYNKSLEVLISI